MRLDVQQIFKGVITGDTSYSDTIQNDALGVADSLIFQMIIDSVSVAGAEIDVFIDGSNDDENWYALLHSPGTTKVATPQNDVTKIVTYPTGTLPRLVRLRFFMSTGTNPTAHVRVLACLRGKGIGHAQV